MDKDTEFSKLYKEHYESIRKYVKAMLGEGFLADDIVVVKLFCNTCG